MNLYSTSAGLVLIGLLALSVTRGQEGALPAEGVAPVVLGVYDARALPVDLDAVEAREELSSLAREAGVDALVSRRELLYQGPGVEVVDLTPALVRRYRE